MQDKNGQPEIEASQVILYDAKIKKKDYKISVRDSVLLWMSIKTKSWQCSEI
ncbi:MAG: hypothetical protein ACLVIY_07560 [Anaerobutyricum soehngenii]